MVQQKISQNQAQKVPATVTVSEQKKTPEQKPKKNK